ncbi:retrovirus-related Pol polyprotein from transposon 17.6 [Trichonephila clavipes]|nr:retrovirus-related Pol polyprotein from transposon 17.6 [Trichonephila clavipes]
MLKEGTIIPIQFPYAYPVVLCRKKNGLTPDNPEAYRFAVDYRKLNAITKYPRYPLPLIDDLIMNIPHTGIISALELRSGYFQMAVNTSDIVKTTFFTKNGTYAFRRMLFGLSRMAAVAEWYRYRTVACFVTGSSPVPLKTRRVGQRCTLNLSRAETSSRWCGVVVRRGGASSGVVHVT